MRILFLINFYPPHAAGGMELTCQEIVEALGQRGHDVAVLTSMHGVENVPTIEGVIHRQLYLEMDLVAWRNGIGFFTSRRRREQHNLRSFVHMMENFKPEIVFIWGMWNLSTKLAALAETLLPRGVVYRFADYWPTLPSQLEVYWAQSGRTLTTRLARRALRPVVRALLLGERRRPRLEFKRSICVSRATRDILLAAGVPVADSRIIHTGMDAEPFSSAGGDNPERQSLELLCVGRLVPEKGVETVLRALAEIGPVSARTDVRLTIVGSGHRDYEARLKVCVRESGLSGQVSFLGRLPRDALPSLLHRGDILVVPSIWPDPFPRVVLEGMAAGLVVVAAATGGCPEMITDGADGFLFPTGDARALAEIIRRLARDPELRRRIGAASRCVVRERFSATAWIDETVGYLEKVVDADSSAVA